MTNDALRQANAKPLTPGGVGPTSAESNIDHPDVTVIDILTLYISAGYDRDAFVADGGLRCGQCNHLTPDSRVEVESLRRLEGASDPADMVGVIALTCPACGAKCTAVLKYGPGASEDEVAVWRHANDVRGEGVLPGHMAPGEDRVSKSSATKPSVAPVRT